MKKIIYLGIILFCLCILTTIPVHAEEEPYYNAKYNNNAGAFFANGNDISIEEESGNKTVIKWWGGKQVVPRSVTVFGGGQQGTEFENSSITMNGGNIFCLVAGGLSTEETSGTIVENANITVNGGIVSGNVVGGGYLYSQVKNSTITINDGAIESIIGGGFATIMIDSKIYNVGTATELQNSPNRVDNVDITVNNITIPQEFHNGIIYGGGHNYAYVGNSNLTINGGDMSKMYVTAGGTDGYTGKSNVTITGGTIYLYQSVNNGIVDDVTTKVTGGNIEKFYVGTESSDPSATGKINQCEVYLMDGSIENLDAGKNNSVQLKFDKEKYKLIQSEDMEITNNKIPEEDIILVNYYLSVYPKNLTIFKDELKRIDSQISIIPEEYEYLFLNDIKWESNDTNIAVILDDGTVSGINIGTAEITASFLKKSETVQVTVIEADMNNTISIILLAIFIFALLCVVIFTIFVPAS